MPLSHSAGFRTSRSASWKHMVRTHKTTVLASNYPGIDVIPVGDWDSSGLWICQCFHRSALITLCSLSLFARGTHTPGHLWMGKARRVESAVVGISKTTARALDQISGSHFILGRLLHISCCWTLAVWWLSCSRELPSTPQHHEPREPEFEVCYFDSTSGFNSLVVDVWQGALCWR